MVIYTSDRGFFLGEHGWFDKGFMYEESFQMPFVIRYPAGIRKGSVCDDIICNVDFAPTWLDYAQVAMPSYMQGVSLRALLEGHTPPDWQQIAYHRYWMHNDIIHHAYTHYGVRSQRYKLIYWYNDPWGCRARARAARSTASGSCSTVRRTRWSCSTSTPIRNTGRRCST
jgi:arylsulfatase A-like enzyme